MSIDANDAVRAGAARISAAWRERRYDDLGQLFADDMVFTLPGLAGRLDGRESSHSASEKAPGGRSGEPCHSTRTIHDCEGRQRFL